MPNKANQHGALKASRKKRTTLLTPSYLRRYVSKCEIHMLRNISIIIFLALAGCTNHLLVRHSSVNVNDHEVVARNIYRAAKLCWKKDETLLTAQIIVENTVTLDSIIVSARFDSFGSGVLNPFIKFIITPSKAGSNIDLYTQEISWIEKEKHMLDVQRWMDGDYSCS